MFFSIIVPVYNVEKYLKRCLDSILVQDFAEYEIIIVNDGSTDNCPAICDEYKMIFDKVKVIHQMNGGLSRARNVGIDNAIGDYILFLDSDDWIAEGALSAFEKIINMGEFDLVVGRAKTIDDEGTMKDKVEYNIDVGEYEIDDYLDLLFENQLYTACAPFTLYRREFLELNHLMFKEGVIHEDEIWTPSVLLKADKVFVSDVYFYYHYAREGSINTSKNYDESGRNLFKVVEEMNNILYSQETEPPKVFKEQIVILYLQAICLVNNYRKYKLFGRRYIINNSFSKRTRIKSCLYAISPKLYVTLHKMYRR